MHHCAARKARSFAVLSLRVVATALAILCVFASFTDDARAQTPRARRETRDKSTENANEGATAPTRRGAPLEISLPPVAEKDEFNLDASGMDAAAWFDPSRGAALRAKSLEIARARRARWPKFDALESRPGVRELRSKRIRLRTDLPSSKEVDQIPEILEAEIPLVCDFFKIDSSRFDDLEIEAFLMADVGYFQAIRAIDGSPQFLYGYSYGDRIYAKTQKTAYYDRFLLAHELVHTLMHEIFGDLRPRWYSEGTAEFLALHFWNEAERTLEIARFPSREDEFPGFGRLEQVRKLAALGATPTIREIMAFEPRDFVDVSTYSWCWAFSTFLHRSPKYRRIAEMLPYWMVADDPNKLFIDAVGDRWGELEYDWSDFVARIDYNYDFAATAIDYGAADRRPSREELLRGVVVEARADAGWQRVGVRLEAGKTHRVATSGRYEFYLPCAERALPFEAPGATCQYLFGIPAGRLLAVVAPDVRGMTFSDVYGDAKTNDGDGDRFRFDAFRREAARAPRFDGVDDPLYPWSELHEFASSSIKIEPKRDGELFLRVNASPQDLAKNGGRVKVQVKLIDETTTKPEKNEK